MKRDTAMAWLSLAAILAIGLVLGLIQSWFGGGEGCSVMVSRWGGC